LSDNRGEKLQLPSGRIVRLRRAADPLRRWEAHLVNVVFIVRRQRKGNSAEWEAFSTQGVHAPLYFDEADAHALVFALNSLPPTRAFAGRMP
jgi:hypothetical protein